MMRKMVKYNEGNIHYSLFSLFMLVDDLDNMSLSEENPEALTTDKSEQKGPKSRTDWRQLLENPEAELPDTSEGSQCEDYDNDGQTYDGVPRTLWNIMDYFGRNAGFEYSYIPKDLLPEDWQEVQEAITTNLIQHVFMFSEYYMCTFNPDSPLTWGDSHLWWDAMITYVNEGDKQMWFGIGKGAMIPFVSYVGDSTLQIGEAQDPHGQVLDTLPLVAWVTNSKRHPLALVYVPDSMRTNNPKNLPGAALRLVPCKDIFWERLYLQKGTYASMEFIPWQDIDDKVRKRDTGPRGIKMGISEGIKFKYVRPKEWEKILRHYGVVTHMDIDVPLDKETQLRSVSISEHVLPIATDDVSIDILGMPDNSLYICCRTMEISLLLTSSHQKYPDS